MTGLPKVPLGDICQKVPTWNPAKSSAEKEFIYVDLSSVDQRNKTITSPQVISTSEAPSRARQLLSPGDVIVSTVRPNLNAVAHVEPEFDQATASTGFTVLRGDPKRIDSRYLSQWVKTPLFVSEMVRKATGASYPAVSDRIVKASTIPLPDLADQRRIATVLDHADMLRNKRREALAQLSQLTKSIFRDMFGDPTYARDSTHGVRIGDSIRVGSGSTPSRSRPDYYEGSIPWVKTAEVNNGYIRETSEYVSETACADARLKMYPAGSILIAMYGQGKTRGRVAVLEVAATTNQACAVLPPGDTHDTRFLFTQLLMSYERLRDLGRGGNQPNLNAKHIAGLDILLPPLDQQQEFSRRAKQIEQLESRHRIALDALDSLFAAAQSRAFRGEL
ncbi:type I restriction modification DNA specificity domain protein [Rhodococcus erythropolis SK121]|nr:type I restriction modification DNA specificity domain protein [Rhodococcus erythropolis SK121]